VKAASKSNRILDLDGRVVQAGMSVRFSYGIPPVPVLAPVVDRDGVLVALTTGHHPAECELRKLERYVGGFLIAN